MKRDSIFYKLFQQAPDLLSYLVPDVPPNVSRYRFDSVAVKEPRFEIDGIYLPPEDEKGIVYFIEAQFQLDSAFYERVFAETALYYYRNYERFTDWQVIIIYPSRRVEQSNLHPHRSFLSGNQVHRIYLDELGDLRTLPTWVALMVLTTLNQDDALSEGRYLIQRTQAENSEAESRAIIEMVTTIISYQFGQLKIQDVEAMLDITFEETRVYRELKERAEKEAQKSVKTAVFQKGLEQGLERGLEQGLEQGREQGLEQGKKIGLIDCIVNILEKKFEPLTEEFKQTLNELSLDSLEALSSELVEFKSLTDALDWLQSVR